MGLIFDQTSLDYYESWRNSAQCRKIEHSLEQVFRSLLEPKPGERVLDIGCGTGNHLLILNKLGLDISGVDASDYMVKKARARVGRRSAIKIGRAEDLPFDDDEFDLVTLINTLEFLDNPLQALREAGRVARRKVLVGVLNGLSWNGMLKRIQGFFGDPLFGQVRFYNLWEIKSLARLAYGPVPISWQSIRILPSLLEEGLPWGKDRAVRHSPFGFFVGIAATMVYDVQTANLPLRLRLARPLPEGGLRVAQGGLRKAACTGEEAESGNQTAQK